MTASLITDLCQEVNNWFDRDMPKFTGNFSISDGNLQFSDGTSLDILPTQYYRVIGSVFNDGVHQQDSDCDELVDEEFTGAVWLMAIPQSFLELVRRVDGWQRDFGTKAMSPFASESLTASSYSYTKVSGGAGTDYSWQGMFAGELRKWRRIRP